MNRPRLYRRFAVAAVGLLLAGLMPATALADGTATGFIVTSATGSTLVNTAYSNTFTITAVDSGGHTVMDYSGTVDVACPDETTHPGLCTASTSSFAGGVATVDITLTDLNAQRVTATDSVISGEWDGRVVDVGVATHLVIDPPATATVGVPAAFTVTAEDDQDAKDTSYTNHAALTSSDGTNGWTPSDDPAFTSGSLTASVTFIAVGLQTITATDDTFFFTDTSATINVGIGTPDISISSTAPSDATVGGPTYSVTSSTNDLETPVILSIDSSSNTICTINGSGVVSFIGAGPCRVNADQSGSTNWNAAAQVHQTFSVAAHGAATKLVISGPATAIVGQGQDYTVTAEDAYNNVVTNYGGDVTISSSTDGFMVSSPTHSTLSSGFGTFHVTFETAGATENLSAHDSSFTANSLSVNVARGNQTITFTQPAGRRLDQTPFDLTATASSGLTVAYTPVTLSVCTVSGSTVTLLIAGDCTIDATQPGNGSWNAATMVPRTFTVAMGNQTISITSPAPSGAQVGGPTYHAVATATSGRTVALTIDPSSSTVCTINGSGVVSFIGVGTCTVDANQTGDANWNDAPQVQQSFGVVAAGTTKLAVTGPTTATIGQGLIYTVTAENASNATVTTYSGTVTITSSDPAMVWSVATAMTNGVGTFHVTFKTAGSKILTAHDNGVLHGNVLTVTVAAYGTATKLVVTGPASVIAGSSHAYTVTAQDAYGNTVANYARTVTIKSVDTVMSSTPASAALVHGVGAFAVILRTIGSENVGATDGILTATVLAVTVVAPTPTTYHPIPRARLLDTRYGNGLTSKLKAGVPATFHVAGRGGIPSSATAVTGNVTVVNSTSGYAIYLGPDPIASPLTSAVDFTKGQVINNGVTVALSATGTMSATYMSTAGNTTDLVLDVTGYFTPNTSGDTYHPVTPVRLLDTRTGNGLSGKLAANTPRTFIVRGRGGVPKGAKAVTGIVTVVNATAAWAIYLGPVSTASPTTSTINFLPGQVQGNNLTVALSATGTLSATYMSTAGNTADLVFDVTGYYTSDQSGYRYVPITPARLVDTRSGIGISSKLVANVPRTFTVRGHGGVPTNAIGITGVVTVVGETGSWAISVGPVATSKPTTSALNFVKGDVKANGVTVALSTTGTLSVDYMGSAGNTTNVILDITGYFVK